MSDVPSFGDRVLVSYYNGAEEAFTYRKVKAVGITDKPNEDQRLMVLLDQDVPGLPNPIDPIHITVIHSTVLHRDTSGDWAFVTEGDELVDEGHVDDVSERLIERLVGVRDIDLRAAGISRSYKERLETSLDADAVFNLVERS